MNSSSALVSQNTSFDTNRLPTENNKVSDGEGAWRSPASALAWGARGRRFKSFRPDHKPLTLLDLVSNRARVATKMNIRPGLVRLP